MEVSYIFPNYQCAKTQKIDKFKGITHLSHVINSVITLIVTF